MIKQLYLFTILLVSWGFDAHSQTETASTISGNASSPQKVIVYVDTFAPYINDEKSALGSSAKTLSVLAEYIGIELEFKYVPYADAAALMLMQKEVVSFPYFYTETRAKNYYYSKPIVNISIQLFFNRQYADLSNVTAINGLKMGTVTGYSYGQNIDEILTNVTQYDSDMAALVALMNNEIDVLPMANGVMDSLLNAYFKDQRQLIRPIKGISGSEQFHVMAPKTTYGKMIIDKLNEAIALKFGDATPQDSKAEKAPEADVAELIPAEGFPAILGYMLNDKDKNYTLPIGTKVVVLDWSEAIRNANTASSINRNMMLTSKVVVLNGPHVGKELMVRNMHIQLK